MIKTSPAQLKSLHIIGSPPRKVSRTTIYQQKSAPPGRPPVVADFYRKIVGRGDFFVGGGDPTMGHRSSARDVMTLCT